MSRTRPRLLMCPPDHYGVHYEINPWMDRERGAELTAAHRQWQELVEIFRRLGASIERLPPAPDLPDMVFTANAGLVVGERFFLSRFRHPQRMGESPHFARWFAGNGFRVVELECQRPFEGAGDALFCGDILFAGYRHRTEIQTHRELADVLGCQVLSLELVDPRFYHLDTCFCPLAPGKAVYYPAAFDDYARRTLATHVPDRIEVSAEDARQFACNAVVLGKHVILHTGATALGQRLVADGFLVHQTDLSEFLKAGGSAKCLTLRLDGEDAAVWPTPSGSEI